MTTPLLTPMAPAFESEDGSDPEINVTKTLRVAMVLPGIGRVQRGAEAAFLEIAGRLASYPDTHVELFGSGERGLPANVIAHATRCRPREKFEGWPRLPCFRTECYYEEFSYALGLARSGLYRPANFNVVLSCSYPWVNWYLRWAGRKKGPLHVFVTQNGDWMCRAESREFRYFGCDGLVCTNIEYFEQHRSRYRSTLVPNGVDPDRFRPRSEADSAEVAATRAELGVAAGQPIAFMASALVPSKNVATGIRAAALVPDVFYVLVGDGPERAALTALAAELLPGRHKILGSVPRARMPGLFRAADTFLHMSQDEPSALVYMEAAAAGLPMVVHDRRLTRWTLGDAACFADTSDVDAVANALRQVLEPARAARLGGDARRWVLEGWTWDHLAARYRDFLLELLAERHARETSARGVSA